MTFVAVVVLPSMLEPPSLKILIKMREGPGAFPNFIDFGAVDNILF